MMGTERLAEVAWVVGGPGSRFITTKITLDSDTSDGRAQSALTSHKKGLV